MSGPGDFWRQTDLWKRLDAIDGGAGVAAAVAQQMPAIERVLARAATSPRHFTLHDAQHSWRVAQQMRRLIPDDTWERLSAHELALLLLSAYLHDIGMTPAHGMVAAHHELLIDGPSDALPAEAVDAFQEWLDRTHPGVEIAAAASTVTDAERLREIDLLVAAYVRHRHVDWSEAWMRAELPDELLPGYPHARDDLVQLCRSHHEGLRALTARAFDPCFVDGGEATVHRRYLAAVLRVADVLDVDPERTPAVVFRHRDVAAESVVYWYKDHDLSISVERSGRVIAEAFPRSAVIHRAIEETVEQIDAELRLVQELDAQTRFDIAPLRTERLPHRWVLDPMVQRRVEPKDHAYEYVNGAFRPDTKKVLDLLGAVQLYGEELSALRELVQNALDAVRERMAWQRVGFDDQQDELLCAQLTRHEVVLRLERRDDGRLWLQCDDSGVGMTKEILTEHYLVSGRGPAHEVLDLRRMVRARSIPFERTGQFGIGVLSYFMLADRVVLETRRCEEAPSSEGITWRFETNGVGSFGELRRGRRRDAGTRLALRLRPQVASDGAEELASSIAEYLEEQLLVLPCAVRFVGPSGEEHTFAAGWTTTLCEPESPYWYDAEEPPDHLRGPRARDMRARSDEEREGFAAAVEAASWRVAEEQLPDGLGTFRLALPYFELPGGACLAYLRPEPAPDGRLRIEPIAGFAAIELTSDIRFAWHGILVPQVPRAREHHGYVAAGRVVVDLRSDAAGLLDVSRNDLTLSEAGLDVYDHVGRRLGQELLAFLDEHAGSRYHALNVRLAAQSGACEGSSPCEHGDWLSTELVDEEGVVWWWEPPAYPAAEGGRGNESQWAMLGEQRVQIPRNVTCGAGVHSQRGVPWAPTHWLPDRLVVGMGGGDLVRVFERPARVVDDAQPLTAFTVFPPTLRFVAGFAMEGQLLLNGDHPLARAPDEAARAWAKTLDAEADPLERRDEILASPARSAAWLLTLVDAVNSSFRVGVPDLWEALAERDRDFVDALWERLPNVHEDGVVFFVRDQYRMFRAVKVAPGAWRSEPLVSSEWVARWEEIPEDWQLRLVEE